MLLKDTLAYLFPITLGGVHQADLEHDARILEAAQVKGATLLDEVFADTAYTLLPDWERVLGITAAPDEPLQSRRDRAVRKIRERGGLSRAYFIGLADAMGYTVEIEEPIPSMVGWLCAGDELISSEAIYQWGVKISGQPLYLFRSGESAAGELLLWWNNIVELESVFEALKPAHTFVYFNYED